ncbi:hypothetical protein GPECTOR_30g182 [Gonium pectorale]|uniref:Uncharacterized protein n=1 Tax=Gonium pectorale TaxID=33097 RepID=A0A150GE18_GONPE|nr:hypothetical protein GPECTOR_30g182 [Gonium pectorale]|eukprot:KXZ48087.1 hypothetical protein GPECTOR_30g182 [Gonium pectorale]
MFKPQYDRLTLAGAGSTEEAQVYTKCPNNDLVPHTAVMRSYAKGKGVRVSRIRSAVQGLGLQGPGWLRLSVLQPGGEALLELAREEEVPAGRLLLRQRRSWDQAWHCGSGHLEEKSGGKAAAGEESGGKRAASSSDMETSDRGTADVASNSGSDDEGGTAASDTGNDPEADSDEGAAGAATGGGMGEAAAAEGEACSRFYVRWDRGTLKVPKSAVLAAFPDQGACLLSDALTGRRGQPSSGPLDVTIDYVAPDGQLCSQPAQLVQASGEFHLNRARYPVGVLCGPGFVSMSVRLLRLVARPGRNPLLEALPSEEEERRRLQTQRSMARRKPGQVRVCGFTFDAALAPAVASAQAAWLAWLGRELQDADPLTEQLAPASAGLDDRLSHNVVVSKLARLLGLDGDNGRPDAPLPEGPVVLEGAVQPCADLTRGGAGLQATVPLKKNSVLGVVAGYVMPASAAQRLVTSGYKHCRPEVTARLAAAVEGTQADVAMAWRLLAGAFRMPLPAGLEPTTPPGDGAPSMPVELLMLGYGNQAALVNDPRVDLRYLAGQVVDSQKAAEKENCAAPQFELDDPEGLGSAAAAEAFTSFWQQQRQRQWGDSGGAGGGVSRRGDVGDSEMGMMLPTVDQAAAGLGRALISCRIGGLQRAARASGALAAASGWLAGGGVWTTGRGDGVLA